MKFINIPAFIISLTIGLFLQLAISTVSQQKAYTIKVLEGLQQNQAGCQ